MNTSVLCFIKKYYFNLYLRALINFPGVYENDQLDTKHVLSFQLEESSDRHTDTDEEVLHKYYVNKLSKHYRCAFCGKTCAEKSGILRHVRIHTGERPFVCSICNASFNVRGNLTRHSKIHSGIKPYTCRVCDYSSNDSSNLKKHMMMKHNNL